MLAETVCDTIGCKLELLALFFSPLLNNYEAIKGISSSFAQLLFSASAIDKGEKLCKLDSYTVWLIREEEINNFSRQLISL